MTIEQYQVPDTEEYVTLTWMDDGLPAFFADREDICDIVESLGFNIYYLIGNNSVTTTTTNNNKGSTSTSQPKTTINSQFFKVVNNIVGRTVAKATPAFQDTSAITLAESAVYNMPLIPLEMIEKLDQFFRLVDTQHGTESIVLLTYDTTKEGPEGWGILVPDQNNTSVHCNYDPTSVLEYKPEDALIVGSVHSHPGMSAYASGTDHNDQADFDGLHITFGWQKSVNNGATQYHIEMQMAGSSYTLRPEDVFENYFLDKEPDPEVVEWTSKVKKALPPSLMSAGVTPAPRNQAHLPHQTQLPITQAGTPESSNTKKYGRFENFPQVWRDLGEDCVLLGLVIKNEKGIAHCPGCISSVSQYDIEDGWCSSCTMPIIDKEKLEKFSFTEILSDLSYWCYQFSYSTDAKPYLWTKEDGKNVLTPMSQNSLRQTLINEDSNGIKIDYEIDYEDDIKLGSGYMLCCSTPIEESSNCQCINPVFPEDAIDFDLYTRSVNIYKYDTDCYNCDRFYDTSCPKYRNLIETFVADRTAPAESFAHEIDGDDCPFYTHYKASSSYTYPYSYNSDRD